MTTQPTLSTAVLGSAATIVTTDQYDSVREQLTGLDADDPWHLAAAIHAEADFIPTSNTGDFENAHDSMVNISIAGPDDYVEQLIVVAMDDPPQPYVTVIV